MIESRNGGGVTMTNSDPDQPDPEEEGPISLDDPEIVEGLGPMPDIEDQEALISAVRARKAAAARLSMLRSDLIEERRRLRFAAGLDESDAARRARHEKMDELKKKRQEADQFLDRLIESSLSAFATADAAKAFEQELGQATAELDAEKARIKRLQAGIETATGLIEKATKLLTVIGKIPGL
ncbi:MAG: hypothetical protein GVY28_13600 [Alphaproteobacteria bacterium]|jgi:DNA repair exonuclease SbcCD ATPase subunit|nr:hypothetical protein [Alphaproteobacteria bacterium]